MPRWMIHLLLAVVLATLGVLVVSMIDDPTLRMVVFVASIVVLLWVLDLIYG